MDYAKMMEKVRSKALLVFKKFFDEYYEDDDVKYLSKKCEKGVYENSVMCAVEKNITYAFEDDECDDEEFEKFKRVYINNYMKVISNLRNKKNGENLLEKIENGELKIEKLASMSHEKIFPDLWEPYLKSSVDNYIAPTNVVTSNTDMFRCGKCGKRDCSYFQVQIRSADEPQTTFVTCNLCENKWKFC